MDNHLGHLGDLISSGEGYTENVIARIGTGMRKVRELLPLLAAEGRSP